MAGKVDKSDLGYLGIDFQKKLVKCFVEYPNFFNEICPIVEQNSFTDSLLRTFVGTLKDYYQKENVVPSYETIGFLLRKNANSEIEITEWETLIGELKSLTLEGNTVVRENALKFFKQQRLIKAANKILEKAGLGDIDQYEECQKIIDEALRVGEDDDLGHSIYEFKESALSGEYSIPIPTGIKGLDETLGGGLDKGKLGLMMAALGVGKTTYSTAISFHAATNKSQLNDNKGWKVLQIYFEDDNSDIARKHFARMTQIESRIIKRCDQAQKDEILEKADRFPEKDLLAENLRLLKLKTGEISASDIENRIKKLINSGFKPDMVIIDYFECLVPEKGGFSTDTNWDREGRTMRKLENMAHDLDIALWVTTQGGRNSITADVLTADMGAGSIKKQQIAHVIISVARNLDGQNSNSATMCVVKNRGGLAGKTFHNIIYNNGTCTISCEETEEYDLPDWEKKEEELDEKRRTDMARSLRVKDEKKLTLVNNSK